MATADARHAFQRNGKKCVFIHLPTKTTYYPSVFEGNPHIEREPKDFADLNLLENIPKNRPYVKEVNGAAVWDWNFKATAGDLFLSDAEKAWNPVEGPFVLVEPNVKQKFVFAQNKDWGFGKWQMLVEQTDIPWVQPDYGQPLLNGVRHIRTSGVRDGIALLSKASMFVGTDGALHHAAAALKVPAVVIWGHFTSPKMLGYESHVNIWKGLGPCGSLSLCRECARAMRSISVSEVRAKVLALWSALSRQSKGEG